MEIKEPLYKLEVYEGPLDLLLDMIKKSKVDIFDIDIYEISNQYFMYLDAMDKMDLDLTADFLVMASHLLLIKSRMLLPKAPLENQDDPRQDLTRWLLLYQECKENAEALAKLRDAAGESLPLPPREIIFERRYRDSMPPSSLYTAYMRVLERSRRRAVVEEDMFGDIVGREIYPVAGKLLEVAGRLKRKLRLDFRTLFSRVRSRSEIIATFLAVLELISDGKARVKPVFGSGFELESIDEKR